jgi:transmembrane sensor/regulatory protein
LEHNNDTLLHSIDSVLYKHLNRCTTQAEEQELFAWLEAEEEHRRFYFEIAAIWSAHKTLSCRELSQRHAAMMLRLNARIDADDAMRRNRHSSRHGWRGWVAAVAAAAVVLVAVAAVWFAGLSSPDGDRFQTYINQTGEIVSLRLDDGTQVWLQTDTELQYAVEKEREERIVRLEGEAYFDVMHNEAQPFVVKTENLAVRVLGTAFNVKAHAADSRVEVVLERGSVRLQSPEGGNLVRLHPNQKAIYDAVVDDIEVEEIFASHFVTQRYSLVAMKNATIGEIISHIEKSYGVKIRIEQPDNQKRYDINYLRSNSLDEVIDIIEFMTGQHCEVVRGE